MNRHDDLRAAVERHRAKLPPQQAAGNKEEIMEGMTTSKIRCGRCDQPPDPNQRYAVFNWLLVEAPDLPDHKIRVASAVCPTCRTAAENAIVEDAHRRLERIHEMCGVGGYATALGDYLDSLAGAIEASRV